jgi:hypothetical protein
LAWQHAKALGNAEQAERYFKDAVDAYRRWGAIAKVQLLTSGG